MAAVFANKSFTINDWRVDPELNRLSRADEVVKIDPQHMKVLELLASRAGEVLSQSEIEESAWAGVIVTPNSVYQSIAQIRRALGDDKSHPKYIETIARKGYRCIAAVSVPESSASVHERSCAVASGCATDCYIPCS
jgi:DNA-binding winged helix-turn-helix (wHTH) protein